MAHHHLPARPGNRALGPLGTASLARRWLTIRSGGQRDDRYASRVEPARPARSDARVLPCFRSIGEVSRRALRRARAALADGADRQSKAPRTGRTCLRGSHPRASNFSAGLGMNLQVPAARDSLPEDFSRAAPPHSCAASTGRKNPGADCPGPRSLALDPFLRQLRRGAAAALGDACRRRRPRAFRRQHGDNQGARASATIIYFPGPSSMGRCFSAGDGHALARRRRGLPEPRSRRALAGHASNSSVPHRPLTLALPRGGKKTRRPGSPWASTRISTTAREAGRWRDMIQADRRELSGALAPRDALHVCARSRADLRRHADR